MSTYVMTPPTVTDISRSRREFRLESQAVPRDYEILFPEH